MSTKTIYGFDDLGNKVPIGEYSETATVTLIAKDKDNEGILGFSLDGAGTYNIGDSCTITASQGVGAYRFYCWVDSSNPSVTLSGTNRTYTFTITEDITLYALYGVNSGGSNN